MGTDLIEYRMVIRNAIPSYTNEIAKYAAIAALLVAGKHMCKDSMFGSGIAIPSGSHNYESK
jgi:hypothetical protein